MFTSQPLNKNPFLPTHNSKHQQLQPKNYNDPYNYNKPLSNKRFNTYSHQEIRKPINFTYKNN